MERSDPDPPVSRRGLPRRLLAERDEQAGVQDDGTAGSALTGLDATVTPSS